MSGVGDATLCVVIFKNVYQKLYECFHPVGKMKDEAHQVFVQEILFMTNRAFEIF